jgi:hypothetical protein
MKARKKLIIVILTLALLTLLRETGLLNVDYYTMTSSTNSSNNWSDHSMVVTIDSASMSTKFMNSQFHDLPVIVLYGSDTLFSDTIQRNPIVVTIDSLQKGFLWTPLYKSATFKIVGTSKFKHDITKTPPARISLVKADLTGHLSIEGSISITGPCSHRHALKLIKELAVNDFLQQTRQYFSTLD